MSEEQLLCVCYGCGKPFRHSEAIRGRDYEGLTPEQTRGWDTEASPCCGMGFWDDVPTDEVKDYLPLTTNARFCTPVSSRSTFVKGAGEKEVNEL